MKIANIQWKTYRRRLKNPLTTAHGTMNERTGILIRITPDSNAHGIGEAAPLPGFSKESPDDIVAFLEHEGRALCGKLFPDVKDEFFSISPDLIPSKFPSLRFAFETACADILARQAGLPLARWLSDDSRTEIAVNYLLPRPVVNWEYHKRAIETGGYRSVKIKVGSGEIDADIDLIRKTREMIGNSIALRLDANRGWNYDTAVKILKAVRSFRIEYVEEPLNLHDSDLSDRLQYETGAKIAFDETLVEIKHISPGIMEGFCDVLVLKPTILGGIGRILEFAPEAAQYEMPVVVTSSYETEIGLAALAHLAAALPGKQLACGLDTLRLFDNATELFGGVQDGLIRIPGKPGLGIDIDW
jgi:o-succinylbenzoate synthase